MVAKTISQVGAHLVSRNLLKRYLPSLIFQTFNCHTFPPVMWCSSKTDLKVTVSELKNYQGKNYAITLEVKPFCGKFDLQTTGRVY